MNAHSTFDFEAFLNDAGRSWSAQLPALQRSTSETLLDSSSAAAPPMQSFMSQPAHGAQSYSVPRNVPLLNHWAPRHACTFGAHAQPTTQQSQQQEPFLVARTALPVPSDYTARLAAHHASQLRQWLPTDSASTSSGSLSPSVLLGRALCSPSSSVKAKTPELTIQERRQLSRRRKSHADCHSSNDRASREDGRSKRQRLESPNGTAQAGAPLNRAYNDIFGSPAGSSSKASAALTSHDAYVEPCSEREVIIAEELSKIIGSGNDETAQWSNMLLANAHDLIHVLSLKGTFLYVSPSVERVLGYAPDELLGRCISEFCHPSDVVPVFRELRDSTSNASIAAAARDSARLGSVRPITRGGAGQSGPQVNLLMRMRHKTLGYAWIESVGKLHLEQGKGRKVVVSSARARPVDDLQWEHARGSIVVEQPSFWSKVSLNGLLLSVSGQVSEVLGHDTDEAAMSGRHLRRLVNREGHVAVLASLRSASVNTVLHTMSNGARGEDVEVLSTFHPPLAASCPTRDQTTVFVHTQRSGTARSNLLPNTLYPHSTVAALLEATSAPKPVAPAMAVAPSSGSVFAELSTYRASSWLVELAQLRNANKRLREEVRQRRGSEDGALAHTLDAASLRMALRRSSSASELNGGFTQSLAGGLSRAWV